MSRFSRRSFLAACAAGGAWAALSQHAGAQTWPARPVRWVVPYPPGGGTDQVSRLVAERLAAGFGQSVLVENRPGGGTIIGVDAVAKAAPDGYTVLLGALTSLSVNQHLYAQLPYDPLRDFAPIALLVRFPMFLMVSSEARIGSVPELVALAKREPLSYASGGNGSVGHLGTELFKRRTGIDMQHIPFKAYVQAIPEVVAGRIPVLFADLPAARAHIQSGRLRVLATANAQRSALMPDVPTLAEAGVPGVEFSTWAGVVAPAGTPAPIVQRLSTEIGAILRDADVRQRFAQMGVEPFEATPAQFAAFIRAESDKWGPVIREGNIKAD